MQQRGNAAQAALFAVKKLPPDNNLLSGTRVLYSRGATLIGFMEARLHPLTPEMRVGFYPTGSWGVRSPTFY
jgi:hypothetical protein